MFASLRFRDFRYLWFGTLAGHIAFWAQMVGLGWLAWEISESAAFLGMVSFTGALPGVILMLPSGVIADRWDRRALVLGSNVILAITTLVLTLLVATALIEAWHLIVISLINGTAAAMNMPARQALGPNLVAPQHISNAVALSSLSFNTSRVIGPSISAVLIASFGLTGCFVFQSALMLIAVVVTALIHPETSRPPASSQRSVTQAFVDSVKFTRGHPVLWGCVICSSMQNLFGLTYSQLMPVFAGSVYSIGGAGLGAFMTAAGIGTAAGSAAAVLMSSYTHKGPLMFTTGVVFGIAILFFAVTRWLPLVMGVLVILGLAQALSMIANQTILNLAVPDSYRGRVNGIFMITWNFAAAAAWPAGWIADQVGAPFTVGASGVITAISMVAAAIWLPSLRRFRDADHVSARNVL